MPSLYEISNEYQEVFNALAAMLDAGEISEEEFNDNISGIDGEFEQKAINIAFWIEELKAEHEKIKAHKLKIEAKLTSFTNQIEKYEDYLRSSFIAIGKEKVKSPLISISVGKPSIKLNVIDAALIPAKYKTARTVVYIDNAAIKKDLESDVVPGAELVAGKARLVIKN